MTDNLDSIMCQEPPQNIEAEAKVLGALANEPEIIDEYISKLSPEFFYKDANRVIYECLVEFYNEGEIDKTNGKISLIAFKEKLEARNKKESRYYQAYIKAYCDYVSSSANIQAHIDIIRDKYERREMLKSAERLVKGLYNGTRPTLLVDNFNASMDVLGGLNGTLQYSLSSHLKTALTSIENDMDADESTYRILTGFRQLDNNLVLRKENLVIIGARPAVGKSAFSANLAYGISKTNKIGIISLEMSGEEIMERFIAMESEINGFDIARRNLDDDKYNKIIKHTQELSKNENLVIDDDFHSSLDSVVARCKRLKRKFGVECIIIDYLQLVTTKGYNKNDEVGKISRTFKMLAKELRIPIIVLSQLSRTIESRENDCPRLSDLRDSGSLEQDANTVIFLWKETNDPLNDMIDITIAKQRQGRLASFKMIFEKRYQKFKDVSMM